MPRAWNQASTEGVGGDRYRAPFPGIRAMGEGCGTCTLTAIDFTHCRCCPATIAGHKPRIEALAEQARVNIRVESNTTCRLEAHIKAFLLAASRFSSARQRETTGCR